MKRLPIPDFDPSDDDMAALVGLAATVVGSDDPAAKAVGTRPEMDAVVLRVVAAAPDYEAQPSRARRSSPRRPVGPATPVLFDV